MDSFFAGLASVVLGVYLLATWTATSTFFVGLAIGIDLVFDGASLVEFAGVIHSLLRRRAELPDDKQSQGQSFPPFR
jgi:uncharacterized membrane protein HdeD (DUF308 family)